jgi:hypothetical protein
MNATHKSLTIWLLATLASANIHAAPDAAPRPVVVLVLHNYAAVPAVILNEAARIVSRVYRELGIEVRWASPVTQSEISDVTLVVIATVHVRIFEREAGNRVSRGVLGIDAADAAVPLATVHVLYEPVGDESSSAAAFAYVLAHLIGNVAMRPDTAAASAIVVGGGAEADRLLRGESPFDAKKAGRIRDDALLAAAAGGQSAR